MTKLELLRSLKQYIEENYIEISHAGALSTEEHYKYETDASYDKLEIDSQVEEQLEDYVEDSDDLIFLEHKPEKRALPVCSMPYQTRTKSAMAPRHIEDLMGQLEETFSERLLRMISDRGLSDSQVYNKAGIDRRHFSKIRKNKDYVPNKKTALAFAIALELSVDETKDLLNSAGFSLSRSSKRDLIVAYCLDNGIYDMFQINELLYEFEQEIFV